MCWMRRQRGQVWLFYCCVPVFGNRNIFSDHHISLAVLSGSYHALFETQWDTFGHWPLEDPWKEFTLASTFLDLLKSLFAWGEWTTLDLNFLYLPLVLSKGIKQLFSFRWSFEMVMKIFWLSSIPVILISLVNKHTPISKSPEWFFLFVCLSVCLFVFLRVNNYLRISPRDLLYPSSTVLGGEILKSRR